MGDWSAAYAAFSCHRQAIPRVTNVIAAPWSGLDSDRLLIGHMVNG
jgi:hypothetical protein